MKHTDDFSHKDEEFINPAIYLPTDTPTTPSLEPPQDLSQRVVDLARFIDRLPSGTTIIILRKDEIRAKDWVVEILSVERNRAMTLPKKKENGT